MEGTPLPMSTREERTACSIGERAGEFCFRYVRRRGYDSTCVYTWDSTGVAHALVLGRAHRNSVLKHKLKSKRESQTKKIKWKTQPWRHLRERNMEDTNRTGGGRGGWKIPLGWSGGICRDGWGLCSGGFQKTSHTGLRCHQHTPGNTLPKDTAISQVPSVTVPYANT